MDEFGVVERTVPFPSGVPDVDPANAVGGSGMSFQTLNFVIPDTTGIPSYWSPRRDSWLREFTYRSDPLKIAVATFLNKAVSIPITITPYDSSVKSHAAMASELQYALTRNSGKLKGFKHELKKFIFDYLTQDNGAFMLVMGKGKASGPITGAAAGVLHLDAGRCQRTGDDEYPVIYHHLDGARYALHYARVITMSNMPSPAADMFGVGISAISCALDSARELADITTYSAEKFGSKPPRQILYVKTGSTLEQLVSSVRHFELKIASEGLSRFTKTLLLAPKVANQSLELATLDLASVPDGFDREKVSILDLAAVAAAFGLDLRDLSISFGVAGQTRADAEAQAKKGRGKGVHEFIETLTERMSQFFLPDYLQMSFDTRDDDQDEQRARIQDVRSTARERNLRSGVTTVRTVREDMLGTGEIDQDQFYEMELQDGRTPEGLDILFLFQSKDPEIAKWLQGFSSAEDPTDINNNDPAIMLEEIQAQKNIVYVRIEEAPNSRIARKARQALAALERLYMLYDESQQAAQQAALDAEMQQQQIDQEVAVQGMEAADIADQAEAAGTQIDMFGKPKKPLGSNANGNKKPGGGNTSGSPKAPAGQTPANKPAAKPQRPNTTAPPSEKQINPDDLPDDPEAALAAAIASYGHDFDALVEQALKGEVSRDQLARILGDIIGSLLLLLFLRGSRIAQPDLRQDELLMIDDFIQTNQDALNGFINDIYSGRYGPNELTLNGAFRRIDLWQNMAIAAYSIGQLQQRGDPYLKWQYGIAEHCADCNRLNGQVHRASGWKAAGWLPRSNRLECTGYNCKCSFVSANGPEMGMF